MHTCRLDVVMCGCESSKCATRIQKKAIYRFWRKNADSYEVLLTAKSNLTHKNSNNYISSRTIQYIGSIVLKCAQTRETLLAKHNLGRYEFHYKSDKSDGAPL